MHMPSARVDRGVVLASALLMVGIVLSSALVASISGRASGTAVPEQSAYDMMSPQTDEGRAQVGEIFIGEVVAVAGEDKIPTSDPKLVLPVIIYDVDVKQTLKGQASDRVQIWYEGFESKGAEYPSAGKLQIGQRYLFFAGFDPDKGWYPVNAGLGVLPIKNDEEEAGLVATFEPIIRNAERRPAQAAVADPCEEVGKPKIVVEPEQGLVGDDVRVSAENLVRPEVSIWWDSTKLRLSTASVEDDCTMIAEVAIPQADAGLHRIIVQDARGERAEAAFEVTKDE